METLMQALFLAIFMLVSCMVFVSLFALMPFWF